MNILSNNTNGKILKNDVLALSQEAKKAKQKDNSVVNATIGSLFNEEGKFYDYIDKTKINILIRKGKIKDGT